MKHAMFALLVAMVSVAQATGRYKIKTKKIAYEECSFLCVLCYFVRIVFQHSYLMSNVLGITSLRASSAGWGKGSSSRGYYI